MVPVVAVYPMDLGPLDLPNKNIKFTTFSEGKSVGQIYNNIQESLLFYDLIVWQQLEGIPSSAMESVLIILSMSQGYLTLTTNELATLFLPTKIIQTTDERLKILDTLVGRVFSNGNITD